jgi:glycosyltransferase involved in cell wall biosynthesis
LFIACTKLNITLKEDNRLNFVEMVSVCIITYNGEKYIEQQLKSILEQLSVDDEVIISDDSSTDSTIAIIESFNDSRIILLKNNVFHSPTYNMENALKYAKGHYIFLADQDDEWLQGRVGKVLDLFVRYPDISLIVCKCNIIDATGNIVKNSNCKDFTFLNHALLWNLLQNPYRGCCMAFQKNILDFALPFPENTVMHDIWIGLLAQFNGKCLYYNKPLINYRRHDSNITKDISPYSLYYRIYYRVLLLIRLFYRSWKIKLKISF